MGFAGPDDIWEERLAGVAADLGMIGGIDDYSVGGVDLDFPQADQLFGIFDFADEVRGEVVF